MGLDSIVDVSITTLTASVARAGFGVPLLSAYFPTSIFSDRVREYSALSAMTADGFPTAHPAYLMATAAKAQNPSIKTWKVGRKALASQESYNLTPTITTEGEVLRLTIEGTEVAYTILAAASVATIVTALTALYNAVVGVTAVDNTTHVTIAPNRKLSTKLTVDTPDNAQTFTLTVDGKDYAFLSGGAATVTEIRDGIKALVDADAAATVTATAASTDEIDLASTSEAGHEFAEAATGVGAMSFSTDVTAYDLLSVASPSKGLTVKNATTDPGIATDLAAMEAEDAEWYGLLLDSESEPEILAAAAWAEARKILFIASSVDTEQKDSGVATDVGSDLQTAGYARTGLLFSESNQQYGGARWMGKMFPKDPGSATWAYKSLAGFNTTVLNAAEEGALDGKSINHYQSIRGVSITQKGYSSSGEFLDITRGVDWFRARLQERMYNLLVNNEKLPFTNQTGDLLRAEIQAQLVEGQNAGVIAPDTEDFPWVIDVKDVADISQVDRAGRLWPDTEFSAFLAGAVHTLQIAGTLSV